MKAKGCKMIETDKETCLALTGMYYTYDEMGIVQLWYPDGNELATLRDNLGMGLDAVMVAHAICHPFRFGQDCKNEKDAK